MSSLLPAGSSVSRPVSQRTRSSSTSSSHSSGSSGTRATSFERSSSSVASGSDVERRIHAPSKRDRFAAKLHEYLPNLSLSGRISVKIRNETHLPAQIAAWPRKVRYDEGDEHDLEMSTHRGTAWEDEVLPAGTIILPGSADIEIGSMRKAHSLQGHSHHGWIALDLVKPDGSAIHLQLYLHLSRHGIKHRTSLGRLDLDSNKDRPQPSGRVGKALFNKTDDNVVYVITSETVDLANEVDDSTKQASNILLGKGVEATTYVHADGCRICLFISREARYYEYQVTRPFQDTGEMRYTKHEVEGATSKFVGLLSQHKNIPFFKTHLKIHPISGVVDDGKGFLADTLKTGAVFSEDDSHVLNYGFSDTGTGRSDQVYAYLTRVHDSWLGDLIDQDPAWLQVPFSKLALAGAHDAGMSEALDPGLLFVIKNGTLAEGLAKSKLLDLGTPVVRALVRALESIKFRPDRALQNLANTQKDSTAVQLRLGVRFFDFRPGYNFYDAIHAQKKEIRHQHALVPGEKYITFLGNILSFLDRNPKEIVFVELKKDGFILPEDKHDKEGGKLVAVSMIPTPGELAECLAKARAIAKQDDIQVATAQDLDCPIGELIERNLRLFIVDRVHNPHDWYRTDSYTHEAYGTDNPATIMAQLVATHESSSKPDELDSSPKRGCIYQLQATPTSRIVDAAKSALTFSDASSLLVWMKARQDRTTYPWIARTSFEEPGNVIFLNDFCDGALVDHAIDVSRRRAGLLRPQ